jgi:predicted esterase
MKRYVMTLCAALLATTLARAAQAAPPCFQTFPDCGQTVVLPGGKAHSQVYASHRLDERNERIEHAVVVVHGQGRNADGYFRHAMAGAYLAQALHRTTVISPRLASSDGKSCRDVLAPGEANWVCSGPDSWRVGGPARNHDGMNSFQVMDEILRLLARKDRFPALRTVAA